jgi:hypothetical protein
MMTYPEFQSLPRGIRKMLLASETFFFEEAHAPSREYREALVTARQPLRFVRDGDWRSVWESHQGAERMQRLAA